MIDKDLVAAPGSPERVLLDALDLARLPRHVAVIMDGNGRWAKQRCLPRVEGHRAGAAAVRDTVETAARLGLDALTLYAFSTENWKRPKAEVSTLFTLLKEYLRKELKTLAENDIRFRVVGRSEGLDGSVRAALDLALDATSGCRGMVFSVALNYSGRTEIADAARALAREAAAGRLDPESIDEAEVARRLYSSDLPDPDLLIRTSGEMRISNFLLWQIAYAEIHVTPVLWPDFRCRHFLEALVDYQRRERRYGGVSEGDDAGSGAPAAPAVLEA
jgi:undecaprenyl diphosphate synthase